MIFEKSDRIGGRIKTDTIDGIRMDHGFQVFLTAYPEARAILDYDALHLKPFYAGAAVATKSGIKQIGDPLREPGLLFSTLFSPLASMSDKFSTLGVKRRLTAKPENKIFASNEVDTMTYLSNSFSKEYIAAFFQPFYKGIFLDENLETSSRMFEFVFKMFSTGEAALPLQGMEEIPKQIASKLKSNVFFLQEEVTALEKGKVYTSSGREIEADAVLVATEGSSKINSRFSGIKQEKRSVRNVYFLSDSLPFEKPMVILTPECEIVNNIAVLSQVSPAYAPRGKHLISVSVLGNPEIPNESLPDKILGDIEPYFKGTANWEFLKTYDIDYALPDQKSVKGDLDALDVSIEEGIYVCGDHLLNGSINAAMKSGRIAAQTIIKDAQKPKIP